MPFKQFLFIGFLWALFAGQLVAGDGKPYNFGHIDYKIGLSNNHVQCFAEDNNGFLWIGTQSGLNRYDGYGFKTFKHNPDDSSSLPSNVIQSIVKDQLGRFWIHLPYDMCIFNPNNEEFVNRFTLVTEKKTYQNFNIDLVVPFGDSILFFNIPGEGIIEHNIFTNQNRFFLSASSTDWPDISISHVAAHGSNLYITYDNGMIDILDAGKPKPIKRIHSIFDRVQLKEKYFETFVDQQSRLWVFCNDEAAGVFCIDVNDNLTQYTSAGSPALNSNIITSIIQAPDSKIWIGTDHGGINIIDPQKKEIQHIVNDPFNENSLAQNVITELYMGNDSIIWIGTFKQGANYYHENIYRFWHFINFPNNNKTLPHNDVNCFAEDKKGNLWIGTNGNGLIYFDRLNNSFQTITAKRGQANALQSDVIVSLHMDRQDKLWIGTYHGGLSVYDGQNFTNYQHNPNDFTTINDNKIWDIFEDSRGKIWIGMLGGGLDMFDAREGVFNHYSNGGINSLGSSFVMDIAEDNEGNMWFGTDRGVFVLDRQSSRFIQFLNDASNKRTLSDNLVFKVFKDSRGNIWAGARNGMNLYNKQENSFIPLNMDNRSFDYAVMSVLESDDGSLWIGTSSGLVKLVLSWDANNQLKEYYSVVFNESDGLQGREFNEGSALKTKHGELIFGGPNGFNLFKPEQNTSYTRYPSPHITGLEIFGNKIPVNGEINGRKIVHSATFNGSTLELSSRENMFSLAFTLIDFLTPKKIHYRYKLEGFTDQWIYTSWENRKATYTNLNPGNYRFVVQSSDFLTEWDDSEAFVNIVILPPWYLSWYAYVFYFLLFLAALYVLRKYVGMKIRNKYLKEHAEAESLRQHELNQLKTRFFTNVSHEFRTPLTLIITPLDNLLKTDLNESTRKHLELIRQNAGRLLNLVNQLLDFRKAEANKLSIDLTFGNIVNHLRKTVEAFSELSETKKIDLQFVSYESELFMQFDKDKVEKIINNLLSNAFKFTHEGGSIHVVSQLTREDNNEYLTIKVKDMGIGIEKEHRDRLFERFYQVQQSRDFVTTGSGIGLSLTKEFVELHKGSISVESEPGQGSCFTVRLPVNRQRLTHQEEEQDELLNQSELVPETIINKDKRTILLVEDNLEFRSYLKESLQTKYNILEADHGKQALELLEIHDADLIVSDIMMPVMDGLQLCNQVKTNPEYSHIPIILLTAKSTHEDKVSGFKVGADEYITKPFDMDILEARIKYLIHLRQKFIKEYQKSLRIESHSETITSLDEKLLNKILEQINQNISNPEFSVNQLSKELAVSRVHLYKKTMSLTGKTPIELIRLVRMKKAADLMFSGHLTISEISYEVGFSDPRYFSKQFKNEFGVLPSKYKEQQNND